MTFQTKLNKILKMQDSKLKFLKLTGLGMSLGFIGEVKQQCMDEIHRLIELGYNK